MPKEKNYNPVQAQRKADKARAIKKGKADVQDRRNEKFARKNPDRIQKQIDDYKSVQERGGKLSKHEEQILDGLDKELKAVKKARDALGDKAPVFGRGWNRDRDRDDRQGVLGKRRRGSHGGSSSDEDVPEDVRSIPMPRDTPPPIPKDVLDQWYAKRRARREAENRERQASQREDSTADNAAATVESRTVYEAKPVVRNLQQEAVSAFVPTSVKVKMDKGQGQGGLLEPEEADRLEQEGYLKRTDDNGEGSTQARAGRGVTMEEVEDEED